MYCRWYKYWNASNTICGSAICEQQTKLIWFRVSQVADIKRILWPPSDDSRVETERQKHRSLPSRALKFSIRVISSTNFDFEFSIQAISSIKFSIFFRSEQKSSNFDLDLGRAGEFSSDPSQISYAWSQLYLEHSVVLLVFQKEVSTSSSLKMTFMICRKKFP